MKEFSQKLAVIIGINEYDPGIPKLSTARFDAERLKNILEQKYSYEVKSFLDKQATYDNIRHYLKQELPEKIKEPEKVRLLFYFAGHGSPPEGEAGEAGYLLPQEAKIGKQDKWLSMKAIHDALIKLNCHHLLIILDCCYAGAFRFGTRDIGVMPEDISKERYQHYIDYKAGQVIASTAHNKEAIDIIRDNRGMSKNSVHSPFAELLFNALETGDADYTNDGITTVTELNLYLYEKLLERTKEQKNPQVSRTWFLPSLDQGEFFFQTGDFDPEQLPDAIALNKNNNPYRGLKPFDEGHSNFFFGRTDKIKELEKRLNNNETFTVVLGISGSGKSSLVKAGLIPKLRECNKKWRILEPIAPGLTIFKDLAKAVLPLTLESSDPDLSFLEQLGTILRKARKRDKYNEQIKELFAQWRITSPEDKLVLIIKHFHILEKLCESQDQKQSLATLRTIGLNHSRLVLDHFDEIKEYCNNSEKEKLEQFNKKCNQDIKNLSKQWQQEGKQFGKFVVQHCPEDKQVKILLVIDQFEHCINQCTDEQRKQFLNALEAALKMCPQQLRLVLTLRSDFQHYFETSKQLKDYWHNASFPVKQMEREQLRETIEKPALAQVLYFETNDKGKSLVDELLDDIGETPGALPLLSFTLSELYFKYVQKQRDDRTLTWEDYHELGGVTQSLTRRATEEYNNLAQNIDPSEANARQTMLRWVMLRMVNLDGGEKAKRRVLDAELEYGDEKSNQNRKLVINRFVDARLLVKGTNLEGNSYVEPVHDVLIREWDKITTWLSTTKKDVTEAWQESKDQPKKKQKFRFSLPFIGRKEKAETRQERFNLILQRDLTDAAFKHKEASEKQSQKAFGLLWDDDPRLPLGQQVLNSDDNWLNKLEAEFVRCSTNKSLRDTVVRWSIASAVITGSVLFIAVIWLQLQRTQLREKAARVDNLLTTNPVDGLVLAIEATGEVESILKPFLKSIKPLVKSSLKNAIELSRERNILRDKLNQNMTSVAISSDGKYIVGGDIEGKIRIWDINGNLITPTFRGHNESVKSIATFRSKNHEDLIIITGGSDGKIGIWNLQGEPVITPFQAHTEVLSVSFSPDGKTIVSGGSDGTVRLWNLEGKPIALPFQSHQDEVEGLLAVFSVTFSPDGETIISAHDNVDDGKTSIKFWNKQGKIIHEIPLEGQRPGSIAISSDSKLIAIGTDDGTVQLWERDSKKQSFQDFQKVIFWDNFGNKQDYLLGHNTMVMKVAISSDGQYIASGSLDGTVRLWDREGHLITEPFQHQGEVWSIALSPDGKIIVSASQDGTIRSWDREGNSISQPYHKHRRFVSEIVANSDQKTITSISSDGEVRVWDMKDNSIIRTFSIYDGGDGIMAISPNGKFIASCCSGLTTLHLWSQQGTPINTFNTFPIEDGSVPRITALALSPKQPNLIIGKEDGKLEIWDEQGQFIDQFSDQHSSSVRSIAITPDAQLIVSGSRDGELRLWNHNGKSISAPWKEDNFELTSLAVSGDGQLIVGGGSNGVIRIWDRQNNNQSISFQGNRSSVNAITVGLVQDEKVIIVGSEDGSIRLWDIKGNLIGNSFTHMPEVGAVAISSDGKYIISGSRDSTIRLWQGGNWLDWLEVACNRLKYHPVLTDPQTKTAKNALDTCKKYVWQNLDNQ